MASCSLWLLLFVFYQLILPLRAGDLASALKPPAGDNPCPPTTKDTQTSSLLDKDGRQRYKGRGLMPSTRDALSSLEWGEIQFLHSCDVHGWFQGHRSSSEPEPGYSGDWADWIDFGTRMREKANEMGVDLLLVDSGDLVDGNGLSDGYPHDVAHPVQGHISNQIFHYADYDLGTIGNHELYHFEVAKDIHDNFAPLWGGRYLTSNVNITLPDPITAEPRTRPIGNQFHNFVTPNRNLSVTAYGVIFDFKSSAEEVTIQPAADMVQENWFQESLKTEADLFVIAAHAPATDDPTFDIIHDAIRQHHSSTPIAMLGGHTHRRAARSFGTNAMALESGRYLETVGWMSISGLKSKLRPSPVVKFSRKYIDVNLRNFAFHAGLEVSQMATKLGKYVRHLMDSIADTWKLTQLHGVAPKDYYLDRVPFPHQDSLLSLLQDEVLPTVVRDADASRNGKQNLILINAGSQRFDIFSGPFTRNDRYIVSPFRDRFLSIQDVPWGLAKNLITELNLKEDSSTTSEVTTASVRYSSGIIDNIFDGWLKAQFLFFSGLNGNDRSLGYQTKDLIGLDGDDTKHKSIAIFPDQPEYIAANPDPMPSSDSDLVDVVFLEFSLTSILKILNQMSSANQESGAHSYLTKLYSREDSRFWGDACLTTQQLYPRFASLKWAGGKDKNGLWDIGNLEKTWSGKASSGRAQQKTEL